ncbi:Clavaminate synthase-like protein [Cryphonectria parasitica EP155]|uniref:Clavaminate synthase-like protein n=1 Tax=Cryphonectria parasitica (strain ATCC 38755 / EP155) TaxID=660469 RepID=A0A9P5CL53_CRYP1|nr:Clavaminate synthase-like protein [Cryphonectria parasitica EP155]KAF3762708.1 Clavaminate synthase-like protein [Cryphonectria parasitica EP155]
MASLPIIDFSHWLNGSVEDKKRVAHDLAGACRRVGFVYIINHGVSEDLLQEAFSWSKKLFDLPSEDKMRAPHPPGPEVHRGYSWPGLEKVTQYVHEDGADSDDEDAQLRQVQDCKESYEIGSETLASQPNQWLPEEVLPGFREFTTGFYWCLFDTAKELLKAMAIGIGLDDESFFLRYHSGQNNQLRLLHYPPVETAKLSSNALARMPAHSDWGSITMLFQDDCGGLQVENVEQPGEFVDATPVKGALVMNVGDLLMRWSNDYLKSTLHRVTVPPVAADRPAAAGEAMTKARYSIPYFVAPDPASIIECIPACASQTNPARYPPIRQDEYRKMRAKLQYRDKPEKPATPVTVA